MNLLNNLIALITIAIHSIKLHTAKVQEPCKKPRKLIKQGNYTIAGLFPLHLYRTGRQIYEFNLQAAVWAEAMIYAIDEINANKNILPDIELGYAIYDTCNMIDVAHKSVLELIMDKSIANELDQYISMTHSHTDKNPNTTVHLNLTSNKNDGMIEMKCSCNKHPPPFISLIGGASSKISISISTILGIDLVPQLSYSSTSIDLSNKLNHPSFLRTIPPDDFQSQFIVDILQYYNWKYINVYATDDFYGRVGVDFLLPLLELKGICVAVLQIFKTTLIPNDVDLSVRKLMSTQAANVTILWSGKSAARAILRSAEKLTLYTQTWIATEGWGGDEEILKINPKVVQGILGVIPLMKFYEPLEKHLIGKTEQDLHAYKLFYNAGNCNGSQLNKSTDNCVQHHQFERNSQILRIKLPNVIDAVHAVAYGLHATHINNTKDPSREDLQHAKLLAAIKSLNFRGASGINVSFNDNGDPNTAAYSLVNTRLAGNAQLEFIIVARWDSKNRKIIFSKNASVSFAGSRTDAPASKCSDECKPGYYAFTGTSKQCCWVCLQCPRDTYKGTKGNEKCTTCPAASISSHNNTKCLALEEKYMTFTSTRGIIIVICCAIGVALSLTGIITFVIYRETPLVRSSNRELSYFQLVITTLTFIQPILYIGKPVLITCYLRPLMFGVLFAISHSIIFTKADRLLRIFKKNYRITKTSDAIMLSNTFQVMIVALLAGLAILICALSFLLDPPSVHREINRHQIEVYIKCAHLSTPVILLIAYLGVISVTCIIYTFRARNLPKQFREGRYIGLGMFIASLAWIFYLPISFSVTSQELKDFALCMAMIISNATLLLVIYGPRTWKIWVHPEENSPKAFRHNFTTADIQSTHPALIIPWRSTSCVTESRPNSNRSDRPNSSLSDKDNVSTKSKIRNTTM